MNIDRPFNFRTEYMDEPAKNPQELFNMPLGSRAYISHILPKLLNSHISKYFGKLSGSRSCSKEESSQKYDSEPCCLLGLEKMQKYGGRLLKLDSVRELESVKI